MPPCWISLVSTQSIIPPRFTEPEGAVEKRTQVLEIGWKRVRTDVKVRSRSEPTLKQTSEVEVGRNRPKMNASVRNLTREPSKSRLRCLKQADKAFVSKRPAWATISIS